MKKDKKVEKKEEIQEEGQPQQAEGKRDQEAQEGTSVTISKEEYEKLQQASSKEVEYQDRLLRQQADFENFKKRLDKEKGQFLKYANEAIILELLTVLDDLERLISLAEKHKQDFRSFLKGVEIILAHLYELLKKHGIKAIDTKNKKFDPIYHEALMTFDSDSDDNKIIEEFQKGYLMEGRVIRTAKVKVARKKEDRVQRTEDREASPENKDSNSDIKT